MGHQNVLGLFNRLPNDWPVARPDSFSCAEARDCGHKNCQNLRTVVNHKGGRK